MKALLAFHFFLLLNVVSAKMCINFTGTVNVTEVCFRHGLIGNL